CLVRVEREPRTRTWLSPQLPVDRPPSPDPAAIASRAPLHALPEVLEQHGPAAASRLDVAPHREGRVARGEVLGSPEQRAPCGSPVPAGAPGVLVIGVGRARRAPMDP